MLNRRDWLKEEVRIRVQADKMVHGVVDSTEVKVALVEEAIVEHILAVQKGEQVIIRATMLVWTC